jgi:uncharacterized membrane protein YccF (DUF307 family)
MAMTAEDAGVGRPLWLRALWFVLVGWWLTAFTLTVAYLCLLTIIGVPAAFWLFDRVPLVLTLKPRSSWTADEVTGQVTTGPQQHPLLLRAVYFLLVGWWLTALWISLAYVLFVTVIGIPVGVMMLNVLPTVATLQRN